MTNNEIKKITIKAIGEGNIVPYFQPIINIDKKLAKYECLARIKDFPAISPAIFIALIYNTNYYRELEKSFIDKCFKCFYQKNIRFSVNLDSRSLSNPSFLSYLIRKIEEYNIGEYLIVEILEYNIYNQKSLLMALDKLKQKSVKIALDDFGSGNSNYDNLLALNPKIIKLDGNLVKNILTNKETKIIVKSLIDLCESLDKKFIVERVSNIEEYQCLEKLGIKIFQGYYIGMPNNSLEIKKCKEDK